MFWKRTFGLPFVRKGLERCDARVALGKSISTSFLFAVLLWHEMKEEVAKSTGKTPGQIYEEAAKKVADSYRWDGLQSRYVSDMAIIWKLQPRFLSQEPPRCDETSSASALPRRL